jgi:hypothetical protein
MDNKLESQVNEKYMLSFSDMPLIKSLYEHGICTTVFASLENGDNIVNLSCENKKVTVTYEPIGLYDTTTSLFSWTWKFSTLSRKRIELSKMIKKFMPILKSHIIEKTYVDNEYLEKIYYYLSNPIFFLDAMRLNDIEKLCSYILDGKCVLKAPSNVDNKKIIIYVVIDVISH